MLRACVVRTLQPYARVALSTASLPSQPRHSGEVSTPQQPSQSPNYPTPWSASQRSRPAADSEPRFEQTNMDLQPAPLSAMELISKEPIRLVQGRRAVCDGGGGPLGHPKVFINLDKPGPKPCGYCGIRFEQHRQHH